MAAARRPVIGNVVGVVLLVLGILLAPLAIGVYLGGNFTHNYVASELGRQRIVFAQDMSAEPEALRRFAGETVDTGPEAKAYAMMIEGHIAKATDDRTFSEISRVARQDPGNQHLQQARRTALEGTTVYGALQNAYGWWLMGSIAKWTSYGLSAVCALFLLIGGVLIRSKRAIMA